MSWLRWHRGHAFAEHGEGGMAELQTDVMRFMAILAFCLVAIFALVQSIPLTPQTTPAPRAEPTPPPAEPLAPPEPIAPTPLASEPLEEKPPRPRPAPTRAERVEEPRPAPIAESRPEPPPVVAQTPAPAPAPTPDPAPNNPLPNDEGFSLRFESDAALRALVERRAVSLYAFAQGKAWQMQATDGRLSFRSAAAPTQFHVMARETVPSDVVRALRQRHAVGAAQRITWGVTLPPTTSEELNAMLRRYQGGSLIIQPDGRLRLEEV